jgi:hypothetical protein
MTQFDDLDHALEALRKLAYAKPGKAHSTTRDKLEAEIIDRLDAVPNPFYSLGVLRMAVMVGARKLLDALPVPNSEGSRQSVKAKLMKREWPLALRHVDGEFLRLAVSKGLSLEGSSLHLALAGATRDDIRDFFIEDFSRSGFFCKGAQETRSFFSAVTDTKIASEFIRAQVRHHPHVAFASFNHAMLLQNYPIAILWRLAGALGEQSIDPQNDPLTRLAAEQASQHEAIRLYEIFESLETLHAAHHSDLGAL